jgi:hypothetical protein
MKELKIYGKIYSCSTFVGFEVLSYGCENLHFLVYKAV